MEELTCYLALYVSFAHITPDCVTSFALLSLAVILPPQETSNKASSQLRTSLEKPQTNRAGKQAIINILMEFYDLGKRAFLQVATREKNTQSYVYDEPPIRC